MAGDVSSISEKRLMLGLQVACALFLVWLYVGDLLRLARAQFASVSVLHELPSLPLSLIGSAVALAFAVTLFLAQRQPAGWRPRRLAVIAAVVLIFADFLVLASRRTPEVPEVELASALSVLTRTINDASTLERVPTDARGFERTLSELGPVPLFVRGERVPRWALEIRRNCTQADSKPSAPGTFIYCVAPDEKHGWVTLTATDNADTFGEPAVIATSPLWVGDVSLATVRQPPTQADEP